MNPFEQLIETTKQRLGVENFRSGLYHVVQGGLGLGFSANAIQRALSAAGVGIARQSLQQLVRIARSASPSGLSGQGVNPDQLPGPENIRQVPGGRPGMYRHQIQVIYRRAEGGGVYTTETTVFSIASDRLMTPSEAMDMAGDAWTAHGVAYEDTELVGMEFGGVVANTGAA